jgi:hypothetical protein
VPPKAKGLYHTWTISFFRQAPGNRTSSSSSSPFEEDVVGAEDWDSTVHFEDQVDEADEVVLSRVEVEVEVVVS